MDRNECLNIVTEARKKGDTPNLRGANLYGANLYGADLYGADLYGANLGGANLRDANLYGADLRDANLYGANLYGANLRDADLYGANLYGGLVISTMRVLSGLYNYQCWAIVSDKGIPWVRMGCLLKTVADWDTIGIRKSNPGEFPNDGSRKSERRVRAFDFTRADAMVLAAEFKGSEAK
jgi:uncharacterized protein YjbI with pentapeptide repeats